MNEDTLILYYYNDGLSKRERQQVEAALNSDAAVAAQYEALCRQLNGMSEPDIAAVPSHTVERWHDAIDRAARQEHQKQQLPVRSFNPWSFAWGAAIAAALAIGIGLNMTRVDPEITAPAAVPGAFTRGVQVHFRDTFQELSSLPVESAADRSMLALQIIEKNRLFERAAEQNNSQSLARVLRAFEPVLLQLAAEDISAEDAAALQAQLIFELNVMLTKLSRDVSNETDTSQPGIRT
jgi:hypothetical protein